MAAFSSSSILLDSVYLPIINNHNMFMTNKNMCSELIMDHNNNNHFYSSSSSSDHHNHNHNHDHDDDEPNSSVTCKKQSNTTESSISGEQVTQKILPNKRKIRNNNNASFSNSTTHFKDNNNNNNNNDHGRSGTRGKRQKNCSGDSGKLLGKKEENSNNNNNNNNNNKKKCEEQETPPSGYIHVRARRGQATDSHSLAERVRREKISERMKMLQKLVPGCEKVTGKALMLDEIINYVQSLQNQVEFLSMKLASLNPMFYDFGMDLETFLVRPEGLNSNNNNNMGSEIPSVPPPPCNQSQLTAFSLSDNITATTTNFPITANNNYPLIMDYNNLQQAHHRPTNTFINSHDNIGTVLWDMEDQRQSFLNPSEFNNLCSFN
ncbi:hypothetical protein CsatA_002484 [Cannabis sativa]